jgi:hypothetical protein
MLKSPKESQSQDFASGSAGLERGRVAECVSLAFEIGEGDLGHGCAVPQGRPLVDDLSVFGDQEVGGDADKREVGRGPWLEHPERQASALARAGGLGGADAKHHRYHGISFLVRQRRWDGQHLGFALESLHLVDRLGGRTSIRRRD